MEGGSGTYVIVIDSMCILFTGYLYYGPNLQIPDQSFFVYKSSRRPVLIGPQSPVSGSCGQALQKPPGLLVPCCAVHLADIGMTEAPHEDQCLQM